jgi:hypothetical protein
LTTLKNEHQIEQQTSNASSLISILNWQSYQKREQRTEQPVDNQWTTTEQPVNTIQEYKEVEEVKKEGLPSALEKITETAEKLEVQPFIIPAENQKEKIAEKRKSLAELVEPFRDRYTETLISEFISYWTEKTPGALKERWQKEDAFDPARRLATWKKREEQYKNGNNYSRGNSATEAGRYSTNYRSGNL